MADRTFTLVRRGGPTDAGEETLGECTIAMAGDTPVGDDAVTCLLGGLGEWSSTWDQLADVIDGHTAGGFTLAAVPDPRHPEPEPDPGDEDGSDA
jgi:hypothetical protein